MAALLATFSCDLTETMQVDADKAMIFGSETGLQTYSWSFYNALPSVDGAYYQESGKADYISCNDMNSFLVSGGYTAETSTSWSWTRLHNINYFLDGLSSDECTVSASVRANYEGIARWFRAYFYFDKLATYGPVPWFDHEIKNTEKDLMYKDRDSRDVIIRHIIEDLDFAYENIAAKSSPGSSLVTKWTAAGLKSRACLFEASFRKYHNLTGMEYSAEDLYREAAAAAKLVMDGGAYKLHTAAGKNGAYRDLFTSDETLTDEVMLAVCCDKDANVLSAANRYFNSAATGNSCCLARSFVFTYLLKNGETFTSQAGYQLKQFKDEFTDRDDRLAQTVRYPGYTRDGVAAPPDMVTQVAKTGYHIFKFSLDPKSYDSGTTNTNGTPIMRYAEILLNYAEAVAELGEMTDSEWAKTIGALRSRAGIRAGLTAKPTVLDSYMQDTFYPDITDPAVMEVRRERAIELFFEGFRLRDLQRWASGRLIKELPWSGIHIPALDTPIDLDGNGTADVYFSTAAASGTYRSIWVTVNKSESGLWAVANPEGGYDLEHRLPGMREWYDDGRQYLYPVPAKVIRDYNAEGYTLTQNPNW